MRRLGLGLAIAAIIMSAPDQARAGAIAFSSGACESDADWDERGIKTLPPPGRDRSCHVGIWTMDEEGGKSRRLTGDGPPGPDGTIDGKAFWSPAGSLIVFQRETWTETKVVLTDAAGLTERDITPTPPEGGFLSAESPVWTPSGQIVFSGRVGAFRFDRSDDSELWAMNADGSGARPITDNGFDEEPIGVAADGKRILFARRKKFPHSPAPGGALPTPDPASGVHAIDVDSRRETLVSTLGFKYTDETSFSPDGRTMALWIAFGGQFDDNATYTVGLERGTLRRVSGRNELGTTWSGPQTMILSGRASDRQTYEDGRSFLYRLDLSRPVPGRTLITNAIDSAHDPHWHSGIPQGPPVPDELPPVVRLFNESIFKPVRASRTSGASKAKAKAKAVRRVNFRLIAADGAGIRSIHVAIFRRRGRSCRFVIRGRLSRRRPCRRPVFRRTSPTRLFRTVQRLRPGTYGFRFRTIDVRRNRGEPGRAVYLRLRR